MKKLKIGILTFHRCINYGSYWQARCLAEGLSSRGHDVVILDHDSRRVNISEWKCAYRPVLPTPVPPSDYILYRKKIAGFFKAFDSLPLSPRFCLDNPSQMESYDTVVVGSDEVWNLSHPWYGKCPLFYGDGIRGRRLVSYAASFGNYNASCSLEQQWAEKLRNFSSISVRDENSQAIVENAIGTKPNMVLDPCLQFAVTTEPRELHLHGNFYAAVYGHNFSDSFIREIKKWARHRNIPLVSIGYRNEWADEQWITADPHDYVHFIEQSTALITNFFHGCIFGLRNKKPFVCETSPYRNNKLQGLMAKISGEKHLLDGTTASEIYNERLDTPLDEEILVKIEDLRRASDAYLDNALNLDNLN